MFFKSLLMVDDDPDDRLLFLEAVEEIDNTIKCFTAANGIEALRFLNDESMDLPGIIFLDLNMPKMDGKQCLQQIKKTAALASIPVIIYSTTRSQAEMNETKNLGADHFLVKPHSMKDLKKELEAVLSNRWT